MSKRPKINIRDPKQRYGLNHAQIPLVEMPHERWRAVEETIENADAAASISTNVEYGKNREADISKLPTKDSKASVATQATLASKGSLGNTSFKILTEPAVSKNANRQTIRGSLLHGRTRDVWQFLLNVARNTHEGDAARIKLSRKEIKEGTGIGSFNTIDQALIDLQSFGLLKVHPLFGSNKGYEYELLRLEDEPESEVTAPQEIAQALKETAQAIEKSGVDNLSGDQLKELTRLTHTARRLTAHILK